MPAKTKEENKQVKPPDPAPVVATAVVPTAASPGSTNVEDDVVAKIAARAALDCPGVHGLAPYGAGERIASLAATLSGTEMLDLGVRVEKGSVECAIDMRLVAEYGASIPSVVRIVRERVGKAVRDFAGYEVKELNVEIVDLYFEDDAPKAADIRQLR